jgi:hypothetical protein
MAKSGDEGRGEYPATAAPAAGEEDEWEDVDNGAVREWPAAHDNDAAEDGTIALRETNENAPILEQLRGLYRSTKVRYIPRLAETLEILGRIQPNSTDDSGDDALTQNERSSMVNVAGELMQSLRALIDRCEALRLIQGSVKNSNIPNAKANAFFHGGDDEANESELAEEQEEEDIESRRGASQRAIDALLARSSKRRRRNAAETRQAEKSASENDVNRRARKMLASEIKAHNDDVLASMGQDVFEVERQRQNNASEALANDLIEDEIERHKELTARGKTPRERIENSLKNMRNRR